jgi:hypothetical protein
VLAGLRGGGPAGQAGEVVTVRVRSCGVDGGAVVGGGPLGAVLPDRLQHPVADRGASGLAAPGAAAGLDQRPLSQGGDPLSGLLRIVSAMPYPDAWATAAITDAIHRGTKANYRKGSGSEGT